MIYELRTYTLIPGTQAEYLQLSRDIGRKVRGDRYGKLEGAWTTEFGTLNQYVHLWSFADLNERERLRRALGQDERWTKEYLPKIRPLLLAQENKILYAVDGVPLTRPIGVGSHVFELRTYRTHVGKAPAWLGHFKEILPVRERHSKIVGMWTTDVAQLNQVVHLWAYNDLNHRAEVRAKVMQEPEWQAFLNKGLPLLAEMQSIILTPTETSPLK
ncbi:MAG: NIPSNAP family protein [Candidatus Rokubacteria bacterium]|nr:NIPSNAP family protein [Candidatus Rokubacteria bacterium]MBI4591416.1 NIPSNAP family protein [Candidatus Rokubacteria bacterium]